MGSSLLEPVAVPLQSESLSAERVRAYLEARFGRPVRVLGMSIMGESDSADPKGYGYGRPLKVDYELRRRRHSAVLETVKPGGFGHDHMADRAQILLWSHPAFNALPRHVRSLDVGGFSRDGSLRSLRDVEEFFILTEYASGDGYHHDLERLRDGAPLCELDVQRADALCDYLVGIHGVAGGEPDLYARRIRELVGHNECIMGILDSYPTGIDGISAARLESIEHACVRWRWRLKPFGGRLRQVHGDFHPWNILFQGGAAFVVLDRSRGEWGEPADDVASLVMNYVFFSLQRSGRLEGSFETLFSRLWSRYAEASGDGDLDRVVAPFLAFRALVMANPTWYPHLSVGVREKLLTFAATVLDTDRFDPARVNEYCQGDR